MLGKEAAETLAQIDPGTPIGDLLRRYWMPVASEHELDQWPVRPVRVLGEDLVLYRDGQGTYGLLDRWCPHRSFDLAYAQSVFTHIPVDYIDSWLAELHRIVRPGGFVMFNVLGRKHRETMLNTEDLAELEKQGHVTLDGNHPRASYSTKHIKSWDVFLHRHDWIDRLSRLFEIRDCLPHDTATFVLRKPGGAARP